MPEEIDVACPGCNAIFGVPVEFCGETAECAECGTMFEIPTIEEKPNEALNNTDTGAIKGVESTDMGEATNTVRLSRTGIGMIPQVKDDFQLGGAPPVSSLKKPLPSPHAPTPAPASAAPAPAPTAAAPAPSSPATAPAAAKNKVVLPDWTKVRMKKGEEVIGLRESSGSPAGVAVLVSIPVIISGAAGIAQGFIGGIPGAAAVVGVIWIITFIAAILMAKNNSRKALVLTNQRSICVIGKERMEVKK